MRTYDKYKDSGIEWIGEIPEHWEVKKFGTICYMKGRIGWQGLRQEEFSDIETLPFLITGMNFKDGVIRWNEVYHITEERYNEAPEIQLQENDLLMTKDGTIGKLLFITKIPFPFKASLNSHLLLFRPLFNSFYPKFVYYQLDSEYFRSYIELAKTGTTFYGITQEAMGKFRIFLPPFSEQTAIANYLDSKTTEIDQTIADKEALVSLYEEEKKALINEAVTKGLNPIVKLKPSGVDWLGEVPEHWEVKKLKYIKSPLKNSFVDGPFGSNLKTEHFIENGDVYVIDSGFVTSGDFISHREFRSISYDHYKTIERSEAKEDDIVISKIGANFGMSGILPKLDKPSVVSGNSLKLSVDTTKYLIKYIHLQLLNIKENGQMDLLVKGSAQPALTLGLLNELPFPITSSHEEQIAIVQYIESETAHINDKINTVKQEIELLKEYRQALIFEAVTGKVKVS